MTVYMVLAKNIRHGGSRCVVCPCPYDTYCSHMMVCTEGFKASQEDITAFNVSRQIGPIQGHVRATISIPKFQALMKPATSHEGGFLKEPRRSSTVFLRCPSVGRSLRHLQEACYTPKTLS